MQPAWKSVQQKRSKLRDYLIDRVAEEIPYYQTERITEPDRLPNNANFSIPVHRR